MQLVQNLLNLSVDTSDLPAATSLDGGGSSNAGSVFDFATVLQTNISGDGLDGDQLPGGGNFLPPVSLGAQTETSLSVGNSNPDGLPTSELPADDEFLAISAEGLSLDALAANGPLAPVSGIALQAPLRSVSAEVARQESPQLFDATTSGPKIGLPTSPLPSTMGDDSRGPMTTVPLLPEAAATLRTLDQTLTRAATTPLRATNSLLPTTSLDASAVIDGAAETDLAFERMSQQMLNATRTAVEPSLDASSRLLTASTAGQGHVASSTGLLAPSPTGDRLTTSLLETPTSSISTPVRDSAWSDRISQHVMSMAAGKTRTAEIRLTPAELGPLRVQIDVDDGTANVAFQSQHAATRDALELALPRLRELLAENGLSLGQANIGEHDQAQREQSSHVAQDNEQNAAHDSDVETDVGQTRTPNQSRGRGLVDAFV